ncbi:XDJ1 [Candida oxycetoniae]|uniref:XDJ1 n=1 Tax=Candida oxycetoniae TaxID=497107 RepID=A0AAI9WYI7_9ASCO|nr:XDJ1 [Candida oxycetoniae]KAI3404880.2 XDJ1 [Candida oxycetoniae]
MDEEDLYEILEVDSTASSAEIKKAYRRLALKYHPDKVSEEEREASEILFKKVSFAYEVLIDEDKRSYYDHYGTTTTDNNYGGASYASNPFEQFYGGGFNQYEGNDFHEFFFNGGTGGPQKKSRTEDAHIHVEVTLEELYIGKVVRTTLTRNIICTQCKGSGLRSASAMSKACAVCKGEGHTRKIKRVAPGLVTQEYVDCANCKGSGKIYRTKDKCKVCLGARVTEETKILEFEIARGAPSRGVVTKHGESDEYPGKQTGDIILEYTCKEHSVFERKGDDLYISFSLSLADALAGFTKQVALHLDGRVVQISTPPGKVIRPGDYIKIIGEGMPKSNKSWSLFPNASGDLYLKPDIEFPKDNWFLEKDDLVKLRNILPGGKAQESSANGGANTSLFTDFAVIKDVDLPVYNEGEGRQKGEHGGRNSHSPQCNQQ